MRNPEKNTSTYAFSQLMGEVFERGDAKRVALALHVPEQHVREMVADMRRNPFDAAARVVRALRASGNVSGADALALQLCRDLQLVAYRSESVPESADACLSDVLREMSDVMRAHADADADGWITEDERRDLMTQLSELEERAHAMRDSIAARRVLTVAAMKVRV